LALLDFIQDVADEVGVTRPQAVVSSTDQTVRTLLSLANREGKTLAKRCQWEAMTKTATWTTTATQDQGLVETLAPGFDYMINQTHWLRGQRRPMGGPLSAADWEQLLGNAALGPYPSFRILADRFQMLPAPPAGIAAAFEYQSRYWCQNADGTMGKIKFSADTDTGIISEDLIAMGVKWRFRQSKGLSYDEEFRDYEEQVNNAIAREGAKRILDLDAGSMEYNPQRSVIAPDGNWSP
jgi:hypothetical protein